MENASKALIIAGAILIAIVLITIGVVILGQGQEVANNSNIDDVKIQQLNSRFTQYCGSNVSGANVNSLLSAVQSNNLVAERDGEDDKIIKIVSDDSGETEKKSGDASMGDNFKINKAKSSSTYEVSVVGYNSAGYINKIKIK